MANVPLCFVNVVHPFEMDFNPQTNKLKITLFNPFILITCKMIVLGHIEKKNM